MDERYMDAARRLELLHLGPGAGTVYWKPAGLRLYERLRSYTRSVHEQFGYEEVKTPALAHLSLFERSGHLGRYRENMFVVNQANAPEGLADMQSYAMRPMSCPNHIELFASELRSYRDLPLRLFEFGEVFRNEASGSLQALFRQRQFCQDDSHVFIAEDQVQRCVVEYLRMARKVYQDLGFAGVEISISTRPAQRYGDDSLWDKAEEGLRAACRAEGLDWDEEAGGGAFYGPKVEVGVRDKLGRRWQLGVVQLDYVLPRRFELGYRADDDSEQVPVILHQAVLGSLERMIGVLLEHHGVDLPEFLHPWPSAVVFVSEKSRDYAELVLPRVRAKHGWAALDVAQVPLGSKLKLWRERGVPNVYVVGEQEARRFQEEGVAEAMCNKERVRLEA